MRGNSTIIPITLSLNLDVRMKRNNEIVIASSTDDEENGREESENELQETFQETFEDWSKLKSREKVLGETAPTYLDFYNSKGNQNTIILSAAMGGFMGGAMNFRESFKYFFI